MSDIGTETPQENFNLFDEKDALNSKERGKKKKKKKKKNKLTQKLIQIGDFDAGKFHNLET